jgi:hypothetical protein
MTEPPKADPRLAAILCSVVGRYDIVYASITITRTVLGYKIDVLFPDFLVFHAASGTFFVSKLGLFYGTAR